MAQNVLLRVEACSLFILRHLRRFILQCIVIHAGRHDLFPGRCGMGAFFRRLQIQQQLQLQTVIYFCIIQFMFARLIVDDAHIDLPVPLSRVDTVNAAAKRQQHAVGKRQGKGPEPAALERHLRLCFIEIAGFPLVLQRL